MKTVVVTGSFDDLRSKHVRFLEEASRLGAVHVVLWSDQTASSLDGRPPKFPLAERLYLVQAIRYVSRVTVASGPVERDALPQLEEVRPQIWVVGEAEDNARKRAYCLAHGIEYRVLSDEQLKGFPAAPLDLDTGVSPRKKAIVTGCYDWLHSGHVRFFEEVSELGELYVVVGHDANVRLLKGEGHPMFGQDERRYMVGAIRYVKAALISSGHGWMDAEPEIALLKPDLYVVNEDGDVPEKREFCLAHGLEYVVLTRKPKDGLPRRQSTLLRGF